MTKRRHTAWLKDLKYHRSRSRSGDTLVRQPSARHDVLVQSVKEGTMQVDRGLLTKTSVAGRGSFGTVWRGTLADGAGMVAPIAVKELHEDVSETAQLHFLQEADLLSQMCHPNVVALIGTILDSPPICIVMELCEISLLHRVRTVELTVKEQLEVCIGAAAGVEYLHQKHFVHRDLAARNVLVDDEGTPKIADFGLACPLADNQEYYKSSGGRIPLRWCAPECINFKKYSWASDVWAFAVVMWEVFSCGEVPYAGVPNVILAKEVCEGLRLGPPFGMPGRVYSLMLAMWEQEANSRTAMRIVRTELQQIVDEDDLRPIEQTSLLAKVTVTDSGNGASGFDASQNTYDDDDVGANTDDPYEKPVSLSPDAVAAAAGGSKNVATDDDAYSQPADSLLLAPPTPRGPMPAAPPPPPRVPNVRLKPRKRSPDSAPPPPLPPRAAPAPPVRQRPKNLKLIELD